MATKKETKAKAEPKVSVFEEAVKLKDRLIEEMGSQSDMVAQGMLRVVDGVEGLENTLKTEQELVRP